MALKSNHLFSSQFCRSAKEAGFSWVVPALAGPSQASVAISRSLRQLCFCRLAGSWLWGSRMPKIGVCYHPAGELQVVFKEYQQDSERPRWRLRTNTVSLQSEHICQVQFSSVTQSCPTLWDCMNHSTPGLPVHHQHPESTQTHVLWVSDAIQPSHLLLSPSPPALNLSQHQGLFQWVSSSLQVAISASTSVIPMNTKDWSPLEWTGWISLQSKVLSRVFSNTKVQKHQFFGAQLSL